MVSMSPGWVSEKLCAGAVNGVPQSASANNAGARKRGKRKRSAKKRNEGIGKSFCNEIPDNSGEGRLLEYFVSWFGYSLTRFISSCSSVPEAVWRSQCRQP